jgi:hypothetical protein
MISSVTESTLKKDFSALSLNNTNSNDALSTSTTTTSVSVNNPSVSFQGNELQIVSDFVSPEERQQILKEVYCHKEDFVWEGFDQRRKVQRWKHHHDLPPTLQKIAERIHKRLCKEGFKSEKDELFHQISFQEYHKSQMLRYLNSNKSHVTTFETPTVCPQCSQHEDCDCFVALLPLTASLVENTNRPKERSVNCWDLLEPRGQHSTSWILPQSSLIVKRKDLLYEWRNRIVQILEHDNYQQDPLSNGTDTTKDTAVLIKFYHVPKDVLEMSTDVPSPEFGYVPTPEILAEELRRQSMPMPPMEDLLTILVTTSPIKSNPSTELLERVFDTFPNGGRTFAYKCRKVIVCDGARQRDESTTQKYTNDKQAMRNGLVTSEQNENYAQFKQNLVRLCKKAAAQSDADSPPSPFANTTIHELDSRHGYGFALRHALQKCVSTPYVIVIQHDRTIMRPTPIQETLHAMWNHTNIKYVGMSMRSNLMYSDIFNGQYGKAYIEDYKACILRPPELQVDATKYGPDSESTNNMDYQGRQTLRNNIMSLVDTYQKGQQYADYVEWRNQQSDLPKGKHQMTLTPTFFWYDNVHICETQHYRDFIFDPRYKMVVRGGFVEDKLSPVIKKTVERLGLREGHSRFGCFLLDDHSGMFFTGHLDGGSFLDAATREKMLLKRQTSSTAEERSDSC